MKKIFNDQNFIALLILAAFMPHRITGAAAVAAAALILLLPRLRAGVFSLSTTLWMAVAVLLSVAEAASSGNKNSYQYSLVLFAIVVIGAYMRSHMTEKIYMRMLSFTVLLGSLTAVRALIEWLQNIKEHVGYRSVGFFFNQNYLGAVLSYCFIVSVWFIICGDKKWIYAAAAVALAVGIYCSGSAGAMIAAATGVCALIVIKKKYRILIFFASAAVAGGAALLLVPGLLPRITSLYLTVPERLWIWENSIKWIAKHPLFGSGFYTYEFLGTAIGEYQSAHAHNIIIEIVLDLGLAGAAAVAAAAAGYIRSFRRAVEKSNIKQLITALAIAVFVHSLTDITVLWLQTGLVFVFLLSGIGALKTSDGASKAL